MKILIRNSIDLLSYIFELLIEAVSFLIVVCTPKASIHSYPNLKLYILPKDTVVASSNPTQFGKGYIFVFKKYIILLEEVDVKGINNNSHIIIKNIDNQSFLFIFNNWVMSQETLRKIFL